MKALLLAAGFGTRLKPITDTIPKPLVPVNGIPLILYNLAFLKHHGITDIVINLHYLGEKIESFLGDGKKIGFKIAYSHEPHILGTGGGIRKALDFFTDEDFLVLNSDIITDFDLRALLAFHKKQNPLATLVLRENDEAKNFGLLHFEDEKLLSILGKPEPTLNASSGHFTGIQILKREPLQILASDQKSCIVQNYYIPQLTQNQKLCAFLLDGYWNDCGTIEAIEETSQELKAKSLQLNYDLEMATIHKALS